MSETTRIYIGVFYWRTQERRRISRLSELLLIQSHSSPAVCHCCACVTHRANWGDLEPSERVSEANRDIYRSRTDRRHVNAAERGRVSRSFPYLGASLGLTGAYFQPSRFGKWRCFKRSPQARWAENLLNFDDEPSQEGPTGLAATQVLQEPAAKSVLSGTSTNPLDDLVSIFGNTLLSPSALIPSVAVAATPVIDPLGAFGGISPAVETPSTPSNSNQQEDLLGPF